MIILTLYTNIKPHSDGDQRLSYCLLLASSFGTTSQVWNINYDVGDLFCQIYIYKIWAGTVTRLRIDLLRVCYTGRCK